jgi:hypothetical protein
MSCSKLGLVLGIFFVLAISHAIASDNDDSQAWRLFSSDAENTEPIPPGPVADQSKHGENDNYGGLDCCQSCWCPCWMARAEVMVMEREGNRNDFGNFGREIEVGPRISLIRQTQCCDLEILFFTFDGTSAFVERSNPAVPENPGLDQPVNPTFLVSSGWSSRLYNAELNARWNPSCRLTILAGLRWAQYRDEFQRLLSIDDLGHTKSNNNLYGFQVGADALLWQRDCFSIEGLCKVGVYGNHAEQQTTTLVGPFAELGTDNVTGSHTGFIGELGLQARYQATQRLAFRAGYELLWLDGLAIGSAIHVPGEINTNSTVFYQGATAGFELSF